MEQQMWLPENPTTPKCHITHFSPSAILIFLIFNSFIEIRFTNHTIHPFKVFIQCYFCYSSHHAALPLYFVFIQKLLLFPQYEKGHHCWNLIIFTIENHHQKKKEIKTPKPELWQKRELDGGVSQKPWCEVWGLFSCCVVCCTSCNLSESHLLF